MLDSLILRLSRDVVITLQQAEAAVALLDGGATVPFIARYRKEARLGWTMCSCVFSKSV